jgi:hypothetical protein
MPDDSHRPVRVAKFLAYASTGPARGCYLPVANMAEERSTEKHTPKKPAKKKAASASSKAPVSAAAAEGGGWVTDLRVWVLVGGVMVFGVVAWKLLGTSYKRDIQTVCDAEALSGFTMAHDLSKVTTYIRQHLGTPEGNEFFSTLSDAKLPDRAKRLKTEAGMVGVSSCPMVTTYEKLGAEGEYRGDVQHLCSTVAFAHLGELDDDARLKKLEDWIDTGAKSPRTKELGTALRQLGTSADRAKLLRDTANGVDIFNCDLAKVLEGPILPSKGNGPPQVRPFGEPQIIGTLKPEDVAKALVDATPAMVECYKKGLETKPDMEGKLAIKMMVDPMGKVTSASPADQNVPDVGTAKCILQVVKSMELPKNPGPLASVMLPLELTTAGVAGAPMPSASGAPAPSSAPSSAASAPRPPASGR